MPEPSGPGAQRAGAVAVARLDVVRLEVAQPVVARLGVERPEAAAVRHGAAVVRLGRLEAAVSLVGAVPLGEAAPVEVVLRLQVGC